MIRGQAYRVEPEFGFILARFDVYMRRFLAFVTEKEEPVSAHLQHGWHSESVPTSGSLRNGCRPAEESLPALGDIRQCCPRKQDKGNKKGSPGTRSGLRVTLEKVVTEGHHHENGCQPQNYLLAVEASHRCDSSVMVAKQCIQHLILPQVVIKHPSQRVITASWQQQTRSGRRGGASAGRGGFPGRARRAEGD